MKNKKQTTELQDSYHAMVNSVEEFVVKEGKTLQHAFHAAEEKLCKAKDISKDKIQQASRNLKENLRVIGETVEGVSEAYKDRIKFDMAYVNNSIWDKLQSIAYSNTAELIEFTRTLKENAQTVITEDHLAAHQQHSQWDSDHALWLDEVKFWQKELDQALAKLTDVEKALKRQSALLLEHAQVIKVHAEIDHEHEQIMTNAEQDPTSEVFKVAD
ncbi:MAG: putative nucleic acid-binding protein, partial [Alphaproteobacteria bacterium]